MTRASKGWRWFGAVLCAVALFAAACGGDDDDGGATAPSGDTAPAPAATPDDDDGGIGLGDPPPAPSAEAEEAEAQPPAPPPATEEELETMTGSVTISGSSTVEPISVRVAELFRDVAPGVEVTVDGPGTGDGFKLFCAGETDISDASRKIKDAEAEDCAAAGINWVELRVGIDGIAVMTNLNNDAVDCLNFEDLYAIVGPESQGFSNWSDAAGLAAELGSGTSFPDLELDITAPGAESGTYDSFIEIVLEDIGDHRAEEGVISGDDAATTRPDYVSAADDNVIIQGIEGATGSFGWVGFAYAVNAGVKLLDVDGGDGCVSATPATIASGEYPVSRSLYIYVNADKAAASEAITAYVDFYMSETGLVQAVSDVGYVTLTDDARGATQANWTGRVIGGAAPAPAAPAPADISGSVTISGSSTVEPISVRVAELFRDVAPNVNVTVDGPGTGDGFKLFCAGETDISDASRQIKDAEAEDCAAAGINWIELRVGIDGIAVMTNLNNDAVSCLNFEDLYAIVGPESQGFSNWSDAAGLAAELGSSTSFPDLELDITAPGAESGTYDSFIEIVLEDIGDHRAEEGVISGDDAATTRPDYVSAADDNVIIQGIEGATGSFGWVGFAYAVNAGVKLLDVDGGDGCVSATPATIASGEYPVSRSLYIYVNADKAAASEAITAYVDFYMSETGLVQAVSDVGYVTLTDDARGATQANWTGRVIGG